jgi:hypothetical protein
VPAGPAPPPGRSSSREPRPGLAVVAHGRTRPRPVGRQVVERHPHLADQRRPDRDQAQVGAGPGDAQQGADPLVDGEQAVDPLDAEAVDRPQRPGQVRGADDARRAGHVEAMVVAWRQVERGEAAALEAARRVGVAEQRRQPVGAPLDLEEHAPLDGPGRPPGAVARSHQRVGPGVDRPRPVAQGAGEEVLQAGERLERVAHLGEVDPGGATERAQDRAPQRRRQRERRHTPSQAREQMGGQQAQAGEGQSEGRVHGCAPVYGLRARGETPAPDGAQDAGAASVLPRSNPRRGGVSPRAAECPATITRRSQTAHAHVTAIR